MLYSASKLLANYTLSMTAQIILASASPRRSQLLTQIGISHTIVQPNIDESPLLNEPPIAYVQRIAAEKSAVVAKQLNLSLPILSADTSVIYNDTILGKPDNLAHALDMLHSLSGKSHLVYSALSLRGREHRQAISISEVKFRSITDNEIITYWHTGEPCDKAGAYAIQGLGSVFVESITGSYTGVIGLPLFETAQLLAQEGIKIIK